MTSLEPGEARAQVNKFSITTGVVTEAGVAGLVRGSHHEGFVEDMPSSCMRPPGKKALILCILHKLIRLSVWDNYSLWTSVFSFENERNSGRGL